MGALLIVMIFGFIITLFPTSALLDAFGVSPLFNPILADSRFHFISDTFNH